MAINLYAAKILKDNDNNEYVNNYVDFTIAKASLVTTNGNNRNITGDYLEYNIMINVNTGVGSVDVVPTNIITMIRDALGLTEDFNDYNSLVGTTINIFESPSISSKLNCCFYIDSYNSFGSTLNILFGDISRSIYIRLPFTSLLKHDDSYYNYKCFIIPPAYDGTSLTDLLNNLRSAEERYFKNRLYTKYMNTPPYAPMYIYTCDNPTNNTTFTSIKPSGFWTYEDIIYDFVNLSRFANWYTMFTGKYFYGTPFRLEFDGEYKGMTHFDLGVTISPNVYDDGLEFSSTSETTPITQYNSRGFSYYNVGHDITYFFDTSNDNEQIIYLKNGYMKRYKKDGNYHYQINNSDLGIDIFCGGVWDFESGQGVYGYDRTLKGLYIIVNPSFANIPIGSWLRLIPLSLENYNYDDCPLFFGSYGFGRINKGDTIEDSVYGQTSYVDWDNLNFNNFYDYYAVPGLFTNYRYPTNSQTSNIVSDELTCNYTFWNNFLSGIFDESGGANIGGGSIGGGTSSTGGGNGNFNDASFGVNSVLDIINPSFYQLSNSKFLNCYVLDNTALVDFSKQCWNTNWKFEDIERYFGNNEKPMDSLIGVKYYSCVVPGNVPTENLISICGNNMLIETSSIIKKLANEVLNIDFGSIELEEYFGNFVDYDETKINIVLPYVGIKTLNTREIMGGSIRLNAIIDFIDGSIIYYLSLTKNNITNVIETWQGVCSYDIPISQFDNSERVNTLINGATSIATGAVSGAIFGSVPGAIAGGVTGAIGLATNALSTRPTINKIGNFAGSRQSITKAYLIIERPKQSLPDNYNKIYGYPSNIYSKFIALTGFTIVGSVHLENMGVATSEEINEIETLLKQGVIF